MLQANRLGDRNNRTDADLKGIGLMLCLLIPLLCIFSADAQAKDHRQPGGQRQQSQEQRGGISAGEAAEIARRQYGGEVLKVSRAGNGYRIKLLLPSGTVKTVYIDASGQ